MKRVRKMKKEIYYNEVIEKWLEDHEGLLAPSSRVKYCQLYSNHIRPFSGGSK